MTDILILQRLREVDDATIGQLTVDGEDNILLYTLEHLWEDNQTGISRIPAGTYRCIPHGWGDEPTHFHRVWEVTDVPGRSAILMHPGNTAADTEGCILVGQKTQGAAVYQSQLALDQLRGLIGDNDFTLEVRDAVE